MRTSAEYRTSAFKGTSSMSLRPVSSRMGMASAAALATCATVICLFATAGTAQAASVSTWDKVAQCEATGNWQAIDITGTYFGGLQFSQPTWQAYGGLTYASRADRATKKQQILIAEKVLKGQGQGAWPNCGPKAALATDHADPYPEDSLPSPVNSQTVGADFNGDGQADIVARDGSGDLKLWTHNAGGYFNAPVAVTGGWAFTQTVAADFDGDGKADLIARDGSGNLKRWSGRGDGTFGSAVAVTSGWAFTQTAAADFDGDGKVDLIARDSSGNLKIWAGRGDGTFGASAQVSSGWDFTQTAAADFNGDHQADIVARDGSGNLKVWTHNAGGYFNAPVTVTGGWNFSQTAAADFDGNGKVDLIARDDSTGNLNIWAGRGDTTFAAASKLTGGW
ncbi:FG-GAP-like repeat-containing protein [Streptomyces sp. NPDC101733]|uniref:FG-GAP-like repeat-containing protein n=1 Tax=unclassified Streptomyces TaxID=2593676 RepID=UPI0037FA2543